MTAGIVEIQESYSDEEQARKAASDIRNRYPHNGYATQVMVVLNCAVGAWEVKGHRLSSCD